MDSPPLPQNWGPGADLKGEMREIKALVIQALQLSPAAKPCVGGQQELDKISGQAERARWWPSVGREAGLLAGAVLPLARASQFPNGSLMGTSLALKPSGGSYGAIALASAGCLVGGRLRRTRHHGGEGRQMRFNSPHNPP